MKWHTLFAAAGLMLASLPGTAHALPASGDMPQAKATQPGPLRVAAATKRKSTGGISTSNTDVDGDGSSDVVVQAPPKPKHKPVRRVRRHR